MAGQPKDGLGPGDRALVLACVSGFGVASTLWLGAVIAAYTRSSTPPKLSIGAALDVLLNPDRPAAGWGSAVGGPVRYWSSVVVASILICGIVVGATLAVRRLRGDAKPPANAIKGVARRAEARKAAGARTLTRRAGALRPSLATPLAADLGYRLGRSNGAECWASIEDSIVVLGPPRSGKGLHLVIPMILDAPGAVVTTSTRPDNLASTLDTRCQRGPVVVFDPQGLARGATTDSVRWSLARGCSNAQTAMIRARSLASGTANGVTEATFWQASAEQAVRCLLHAADLADMSTEELYRWSLSPVLAAEAVGILSDEPDAAPGWADGLSAILSADQRQRDSVWAMVGIAFNALADPDVLRSVSPEPGEKFDPATFLARNGTAYVLGTSSGAASCANLVAAFVEDIAETARQLAAGSVGGRVEPPLSLILDEAANYRLASLPSLVSEGGGSGISTVVVLQSLAQARAAWGEQAGVALWDAANVKVILGGGSNARDLEDLSKLAGTRTEQQTTESIGRDSSRSRSISDREVPILDLGRLRELRFGTAVLLLRSAKPILLGLEPWTRRRDASALLIARRATEDRMRLAHRAG